MAKCYPDASLIQGVDTMKKTFLFPLTLALIATASLSPLFAQDIVTRMEDEHQGDTPIESPAAATSPAQPIVGAEVAYATIGGQKISGYLARPEGRKANAAILVIQEWWGLNDNIRKMADRLAGEGYVALAVDLYEGEVAETRDQAAGLMRKSMEREEALEENLQQAYNYLTTVAGASKVGVIGWCFGGGWSLRTAMMMGDRIDAAVIYYGRLITDSEKLSSISAPILGIFGELDGGIPVETVREFEAALEALRHDAAIHVYPDADHAFANPSGTRYNEEAATDAWAKTLSFFDQYLR
jgi:carboxymethylenebutenolidase